MKLASILVHAAAFSVIGLSAVAQTPPPAAPGMDHARMREDMRGHMQARRQAMAADLHLILGIRPDQEGAWRAFQEATAPQPFPMDRPMSAPDAMTTPQMLDRMDAMVAERQARMRRHATAVRNLYAGLSAQQQQVFDALARLRAMHGGGDMHGMGGMHEGHGWDGHGDGFGPPPPPGD